jgi:hypothetical protein
MFRAGLYTRVSTNDDQPLAMQSRAMPSLRLIIELRAPAFQRAREIDQMKPSERGI